MAVLNGTDFNFYQQAVVTSPSFQTNPDMQIAYRGQRRVIFICTAGYVEASFNGNTLHCRMDSSLASNQLNFGVRHIGKIWLRGSGTIQVHAYGV